MPHALITGGSLGLGRTLAFELARRGWSLTIDARHLEPLASTATALSELTHVNAIPGDIGEQETQNQFTEATIDLLRDPETRERFAAAGIRQVAAYEPHQVARQWESLVP